VYIPLTSWPTPLLRCALCRSTCKKCSEKWRNLCAYFWFVLVLRRKQSGL